MPKKTNANLISSKEFAAFYNDRKFWGKIYIDDETDDNYFIEHFSVGTKKISARVPTDFVDLSRLDGILGWQGEGREPANMPSTVIELFKQWKKTQNKVLTLLIEVAPEHADALIKAIKSVETARVLHGPK